MADMLRVISRHERLALGARVELIEVSPWMRAKQRETLCGPDTAAGGADAPARTRDGGIPVSWHDNLRDLLAQPEVAPAPSGAAPVPTIVVAHEFLDALPVHKFRRAPAAEAGGRPGFWREVLVDVNDDEPDARCPLRLVLAPGPTPALGAYGHLLPAIDDPAARGGGGTAAARALVGAPAAVRRSATAGAGVEFEVCPLGLSFATEVASALAASRGAALFIDYGPASGAVADSARAIVDHRFVELLDAPGEADLSALVDFEAIGDAARAVPGVAVGAVGTQRELLGGLGLEARVNALLRGASREDARNVLASAERLVASPGMGEEYKAIAFADTATGVPIPFRVDDR
jgi:NADH dehydrogenase [ubiquinone] 1 alpha subcomplex assembly factor 7